MAILELKNVDNRYLPSAPDASTDPDRPTKQ